MLSTLKTTAIFTVAMITLSACVTTPKSSMLLTGINKTHLDQAAAAPSRTASDPVCITFYKNVQQYLAKANKPKRGEKFLTNLGVSVLAGVTTASIVPSGLGTIGQIAANQTVSSTVSQGSGMVLKDIKKNSGTATKINGVATEIGCPISISP